MELSRDKVKEIINDDWLLMDDCEGNKNCDVVKELARIALASLEAEPVCYLTWHQGFRAPDDCEEYVVEAKPGDKSCDGSPAFPVYTAPPAPALSIDKVKLGEWLDNEVGGVRPEQYDSYMKSFYENVMPAPVSDLLLSELLAIAKTAANAADECAHAEWNDNSMEHSAAIADWNRRTAMLQAEPVSNSDELPLDYLQGHKDGLEWAAQLAEANHPQTGDWLYDDPIELARAIRKGPDIPEFKSVSVDEDDNFYSWFGRFWYENYQKNNYTTSAKQMLGTMAEFAYRAGRESAALAANSPVTPDDWQLVPKEPTEAMNKAGWAAINEHDAINPTYRAMLAAAPQQEVKP